VPADVYSNNVSQISVSVLDGAPPDVAQPPANTPPVSISDGITVQESDNDPDGVAINSLDVFSDADGDELAGVAVVGNTAHNYYDGVWQYSSDGGNSWADIGYADGDYSSVILSADSLLRFIPGDGYSGGEAP